MREGHPLPNKKKLKRAQQNNFFVKEAVPCKSAAAFRFIAKPASIVSTTVGEVEHAITFSEASVKVSSVGLSAAFDFTTFMASSSEPRTSAWFGKQSAAQSGNDGVCRCAREDGVGG